MRKQCKGTHVLAGMEIRLPSEVTRVEILYVSNCLWLARRQAWQIAVLSHFIEM